MCQTMTNPKDDYMNVTQDFESTRRFGPEPETLVICGDPIVGRTLVLLLKGSGYDAKFVPFSSLNEPEILEGAGLLLITPMPGLSNERRETLVALLTDKAAAGMPILELVATVQESRSSGARVGVGAAVPWPCSTEELRRRIETALFEEPDMDCVDNQGLPTPKKREETR